MPKKNTSSSAVTPRRAQPQTPSNWPSNVQYLTRPYLSKRLPASTATPLGLSSPSPPSTPSSLVRIRAITTPAHPACGQFGLFAARTLPARSFVIDYLGYVHDAADADDKSDYDLCLDRELGVGVDAARMGNEGRFVNDYRGVPGARGPNVVFETRRVGTGASAGQVRMAIWVGPKEVKKGEELLVSYGKGFWKERGLLEGSEGGVT